MISISSRPRLPASPACGLSPATARTGEPTPKSRRSVASVMRPAWRMAAEVGGPAAKSTGGGFAPVPRGPTGGRGGQRGIVDGEEGGGGVKKVEQSLGGVLTADAGRLAHRQGERQRHRAHTLTSTKAVR